MTQMKVIFVLDIGLDLGSPYILLQRWVGNNCTIAIDMAANGEWILEMDSICPNIESSIRPDRMSGYRISGVWGMYSQIST